MSTRPAAPGSESPLWLSIAGNISLTVCIGSLVILILPYGLVSRIKVVRKIRGMLAKYLRRMVYLSAQGPFYRLFAWCGRRGGFGFLSSSCQPPYELRLKPTGCHEVVFYWKARMTSNPFHEETYEIEWRDTADANEDAWHVARTSDGELCVPQDMGEGIREHGLGKRWRIFIGQLAEQARIVVRVRAKNRKGIGAWSELGKVQLLTAPSKDWGGVGPLTLDRKLNSSPMGTNKQYSWTQTQCELGFRVPIADDWKAKDIRFKATAARFELHYTAPGKSEMDFEDVLSGKFCMKVVPDEVFWEIDDDKEHGRHIRVDAHKEKKLEKWPSLMEGDAHPRIDVAAMKFFSDGKDGGDPYGGLFSGNGLDIYE